MRAGRSRRGAVAQSGLHTGHGNDRSGQYRPCLDVLYPVGMGPAGTLVGSSLATVPALTVRAIFRERLQRLHDAEIDDDAYSAYFDHKMSEHEVDQNNPEVIEAVRAFLDFVIYRDSLQNESIAAFSEGRRDAYQIEPSLRRLRSETSHANG